MLTLRGGSLRTPVVGVISSTKYTRNFVQLRCTFVSSCH